MLLVISILCLCAGLFLIVFALGITRASSLADELLGRLTQAKNFPDLLDRQRS